jgi:hypothetical protein
MIAVHFCAAPIRPTLARCARSLRESVGLRCCCSHCSAIDAPRHHVQPHATTATTSPPASGRFLASVTGVRALDGYLRLPTAPPHLGRDGHCDTTGQEKGRRGQRTPATWMRAAESPSPCAATADAVCARLCEHVDAAADGRLGKSSITLRLVRSQWTSDYDPTIGATPSPARAFCS